jgi:hypothetical protein
VYDKVNWDFLQQTLRIKGFSEKWCHWIRQIVSKGTVGVKVNDNIDRYFQTKKGLRQVDMLSPLLFNLVPDMLSILINRVKDDGQVRRLAPHLVDDGISILQYADDTILFMENDLEQAANMKLLLYTFEQLLGLKIDFHKSEVFWYGEAKEIENHYTNLFKCGLG